MTNATLELIADYACHTGEGPLWHPEHRALYWCDIPNGRLFRYYPADHFHECCWEDTSRPLGGYTIQKDGTLLLFRDQANVVVWSEAEIVSTVIAEIPELIPTRFNDVVADPEGRVYCGSISTDNISGRLYRLDRDGSIHVLLTDQGTPNGMGFSPDLKTMYYNDSRRAKTWAFTYDRRTGALSNQRLFRDADARNDPGRPDGLTVDAAGYIWTARWEGASILRFAPDGSLDAQFDVPQARNVSSLAFAPRFNHTTGQWSSQLIDLYITTAGLDNRKTTGAQGGALFRMRFANDPYRGQTEHRSGIVPATNEI